MKIVWHLYENGDYKARALCKFRNAIRDGAYITRKSIFLKAHTNPGYTGWLDNNEWCEECVEAIDPMELLTNIEL